MASQNESRKPIPQPQQPGAILKLEIFQNGSMNLNAPLPPKEVVKLLQNVCVELTFGAFQPKEESGILIPDIVPGRVSNESH